MADGPGGSGRRFGPYTVLRKLGEGGMGQVYVARSPGGRLVAVKTIREEHLRDPGFRERFRVEARAARRVSGAFTAPVIDADADAPIPWLATAFVDAPTLAEQVSAHGPLDGLELRRLAAGLAEALGSVHAAGLVHRDLKPSNILMAADGPRLIDFGIAGALEVPDRARQGGRPVGSPGYISPERYAGYGATEAADVFSLGAVLCFAATGEGPFGSGSPELLDARATWVTPDLAAIEEPMIKMIAGYCLARDPEARPGTRDVLGMLAGSPFAPARPVDAAPPRTWWRRRRITVGSGLGVLAVLAVVSAALLWPTGAGAGSGDGAGFAWSLAATGTDALVGMWSGTDTIVVGSQAGGLVDYDAATGKRSWSWKPPTGDGLCGMSPSTSAGVGTVMYGPAQADDFGISCTGLQAISLSSGHSVWHAPIGLSASGGSAPQPSDGHALSIGDGGVTAPYFAVADESAGQGPNAVADVLLASATSGKPDWSTDHGGVVLPDGCAMTDTVQLLRGVVYGLGECNGGQRTDLLSISGSADSAVRDLGSVGACGPTSSGTGGGYLTSDADYLLVACAGSSSGSELWSLHQGSAKPVRLSLPTGVTVNPSAAGDFAAPGGILLSGDAVYMAAVSGGSPAELALSLATGKPLWSHAFSGASVLVPLVTNGSTLDAVTASASNSAQFVALELSNGAQVASQALGSAIGDSFTSFTDGADLPYAAAVGSHIAILFPQPLMSGGKSLAVLTVR